jgi:hypothetical protein
LLFPLLSERFFMPAPEHVLGPLRASADPDAKVLVLLAEAGADLQKPHVPEFAFEVETADVAQAIANELSGLGLGFDVDLYVPAPEDANPNHWVVAKRTMVLELSVVTELSAQFEALALKHHVSYDGWGAEIVE